MLEPKDEVCELCGAVLPGTMESEAVAVEERRRNGWEDTDYVIVCDDCYARLMAAYN